MTDELEQQFSRLGRTIFHAITDRVSESEGDEWCETVMEEAAKIGLALREPYDPARHGSIECEPGDLIWSWAHLPPGWATSYRFLNPITRQVEPDPSKCGVLEITKL